MTAAGSRSPRSSPSSVTRVATPFSAAAYLTSQSSIGGTASVSVRAAAASALVAGASSSPSTVAAAVGSPPD